jgi:hypothetical protein
MMTKTEVIDALKTELSKTYVIRTTQYESGKIVKTSDREYPNEYLSFDRPVIEAALALLEGQNEI